MVSGWIKSAMRCEGSFSKYTDFWWNDPRGRIFIALVLLAGGPGEITVRLFIITDVFDISGSLTIIYMPVESFTKFSNFQTGPRRL